MPTKEATTRSVKMGSNQKPWDMIKTYRGRGGGLELAKEPKDVNIGQVFRLTENNFDLVECFDANKNQCILSDTCRLKGVFNLALSSFLEVLDRFTLEDLSISFNIGTRK